MFAELQCRFDECAAIVMRKDMDDHVKQCEHRIIECRHCKVQVSFKYKQVFALYFFTVVYCQTSPVQL